MHEIFERTIKLIGNEALERLEKSHVIVFGLGGVGGIAAEALVRGGIGRITLVDNDIVAPSNLNRQVIATERTIGQKKILAAKERFLSIRPDLSVSCIDLFILPETLDQIDFAEYDYVIDAIDTVSAKLAIAKKAKDTLIPLISAMGAGNKLDPSMFKVMDISKTSTCPLARIMRKELKKKYGISHMKVVYSEETAIKPQGDERVPGSVSFVPGVAGFIAAGEVLKDLINNTGTIPT